MQKSEEQWRAKLTAEEFRVLRQQGTEPAFKGQHTDAFPENGGWYCKACDHKLFAASMKFPSSCGWPSFNAASADAIIEKSDHSHGMRRTEVVCQNCDSHLGHVFNDGPPPTGLRYCINSICLVHRSEDDA